MLALTSLSVFNVYKNRQQLCEMMDVYHPSLMQVCRAAGYYQHALFVSQAAAETQWYLDILLEDMQSWDDALAYLQNLPRQQAAAALKKHGKASSTTCCCDWQ